MTEAEMLNYIRQLYDEERQKNAALSSILFEHLGILPTEEKVEIGGDPHQQILSAGKNNWNRIRERLELKHRINKQTDVRAAARTGGEELIEEVKDAST